ncbi:uncharacterized membrane-anchored protein YitT (DUF2179 family) [Arcicella aurantiaca]|uniref:Uncharacterized membrane-anchored protein YitT (DUF2179 family) n=1 Tax=Arcicella aurantiaca TaxID=591202 RepID=A0A316E740_9BACT|nr:YitT family protein [Arcicella aurantiaca]PWK26527.1 uncharacterized membrane-anchored protein YitT (DUF2179 family) [Arcicella aurantiaca]
MNPILKQLVIDTLTRKLNKKPKDFNAYSEGELAKGLVAFKGTLWGYFKDFLFITAGVFSAAFGFKGFLLTNHFIDGGATGISLLISAITSIPLAILLVVVNIPFILLGYRIMGKSFALKTALAISGLALVVATISFPNITNDNLLVALFGGFFLGAGIGLSVRGGAVIDGTEVLAIFLSRKFGTTMGDIIIMINVLIFGTAAYFLSVEIALYSMVTYLSASKTLDFVIEGIEEYTGVTIVSPLNEEIRDIIINKLGHGVTMYNGKGGYGKMGESKNIEIIYTVVTRLELNKLNEAIKNIDPEAFVVMSSIKDTKGGMIKKRPLDH